MNIYQFFINEQVGIRQLMPKDVNILLKAGFLYKSVLDQALGQRFSKVFRITPPSTGLVACNVQEDRALGFISLVEHTNWLYSIKFLFVEPVSRKLGIATGLINYAKSLAKERGVRKVFLNANSDDSSLTQFYLKRSFTLITDSLMVWGRGSSKKLQNSAIDLQTSFKAVSEGNTSQAFDFYKTCMGQQWIDFFEINQKNLLNGFSQDNKPLFSKRAFFIKPEFSLALVSRLAFLHSGYTELYVPSKSDISTILTTLSCLLSKKGITYSKLTVLNINGNRCLDLLKESEFYPFQAKTLGLIL